MTKSYLTAETTIRSWLLTTDHKRIGILYLGAVTLSLFLGGVFALLVRLEHLTPGPTIVTALTYNRLFTMHGIIMVWMFLVPAVPGVFGNFLLPIMIGAQDVAFPRLNLASVYIYVLGAAVTVGGMAYSGADTGWTFYVPYSSTSPTAVVPVVIGIFIIGLSSIATGVNFIVTTHTLRTKGLTWSRLPLFVWAVYGTSIIIVLATPVLGVSLALVGLDHGLNWGIFDPARGGDPLLFQHLFWFYSHPAVYIMILPSLGVISEVVSSSAHKQPASYRLIVASTFGIAFVGFLTWGHHMFVSGMSVFDVGAFGILSMLVAIFSAIKVFTWVGTLYGGSISIHTPLFYTLAFIFLFIFGGMTGVAVASTSLDVHWQDTYFVVAHFHFIMVGGAMTGFLAALHYWWPKMTGRMYSERWGLLSAALVFAGFNLTFVPQFLLGNEGAPRRYFDYPARYQTLHVISTAGSWLLGVSLLITVIYLLVSLKAGKKATANPWQSAGFEWRVSSPPPPHNFERPPDVERGCYDYEEESEQQVRAHG